MTIDASSLPRTRRLPLGAPTSTCPQNAGSARSIWARRATAVALLVSFAAPVAAAEPGAPAVAVQPSAAQPSAAQKETARTWLREGYEALEKGQEATISTLEAQSIPVAE